MFLSFCLLVFLNVGRFGFAIDFLGLVSFAGADIVLFHLEKNQFSGQCDGPDVMSGTGFNCDYISFFQRNFRTVEIIPFAGIFELDFYIIGCVCRIGHIAKPIVGVQFIILYFAASFFTHAATSCI